MGRIIILQLMYMSNIPTKRCDEAINLFKTLLFDTHIYNTYRHLNKFYYTDRDWLNPMTQRYKKEEWDEFRIWLQIVIKSESRKLKLPSFYMKNYSLCLASKLS